MDILIILLIGVLIFGIIAILFVMKFDRVMSVKNPVHKKYSKSTKEKKD